MGLLVSVQKDAGSISYVFCEKGALLDQVLIIFGAISDITLLVMR